MRREKNLVRYLFQWLLAIFVIFALVGIGFNVLTYLREREYYFEIIEEEQQNRIDSLSRNVNEELTKLKITADMKASSDLVLELCNLYDFVNSFEKNEMIEEIRESLVELDNMNSFVKKSSLYLPKEQIEIDREGYCEAEDYEFLVSLSEENELISVEQGRAFLIEKFPKTADSDDILSLFVIELNVEQILEELRFSRMTEKDIFVMTSPQGNEIYLQTGHMEDFFPGEFVCGEKMFWKGQWYLPLASRALSEGNCASCGSRRTMPQSGCFCCHRPRSYRKYTRFCVCEQGYSLYPCLAPTACENLPPAALSQIWVSLLRRHPFSFCEKETKTKGR